MRWLRIVAIVLGILTLTLWWLSSRTIDVKSDGFVFLPLRTSVAAAVDSVHAHCALPTPWLVKSAARVTARLTGRKVQAGWYKFDSATTQFDVLHSLFTGDRRPTVRLTIPEGSTYRTIASLIQRDIQSDSSSFVGWCENDSVCSRYGVPDSSMEGYIKPDTYEFFWREDVRRVGDKLARAFAAMWRDQFEGQLANSGFTRHEIITLASIVQAETGANNEMPKIAGVYANRLKRGMRLEADPTVQYGLGIKRRLMYRDLDKPHAYNTYVHSGLPPGPINCPGREAISAALNPESHNYIFFVARGDATGLHNFATTGAEHALNVKRYRATR